MKSLPYLITAFVLAWAAFPARAESAQAVLARMDREAASFRQLTAKVKKVNYIAVLKDTSEETGSVWIKRSGKNVQMRTEITEPEPKSVGVDGRNVMVYLPKINTVQIWDLDKYRALVDQLVLLGFGSSGKELEKNYGVTAAGEETVAGKKTTRLELIPKSKAVVEQIEKVELWVPHDAGHPLQQRFMQPGGDYYLVSYSDIQQNPGLADEAFRVKLPAGVKKEYPQK